MKRVIVCNQVVSPLGEHWEVWIDGQDVLETKFKDFVTKPEAEAYAQDLAAIENIEVVFP